MLSCLWDLVTWPFQLLGSIVGWILSVMGNLIGFSVGCALCLGGVIACLTIVGAFVGVPLVIFGSGLMVKSLF